MERASSFTVASKQRNAAAEASLHGTSTQRVVYSVPLCLLTRFNSAYYPSSPLLFFTFDSAQPETNNPTSEVTNEGKGRERERAGECGFALVLAMPADYTSVLSEIFSKAQLSLGVPLSAGPRTGFTAPTSGFAALSDANVKASSSSLSTASSGQKQQRETAYFDETLRALVSLRTPASAYLPAPAVNSPLHSSAVSLPLPPPSPSSYSISDDQDDSNEPIPRLLSALLFSLHVALQADYIPQPHPQLPSQPNQSNPFAPLPTVTKGQSAFQSLASPAPPNPSNPNEPSRAAGQFQPIPCYSIAWAGNKPAKKPATTNTPAASSKPGAEASSSPQEPGGSVRFEAGHWVVEWDVQVPIAFIATPFVPLLSLTSSLTLRLSQRLLDTLLTEPGGLSSLASGFSHSLLSPLHEGPIYPDESTSERLARIRASSTLGLDGPDGLGNYLAELGKDVLGSTHTLVTPKSSLDGLSQLEKKRRRMLEAALAASNPEARSGSRSEKSAAEDDGDLAGGIRSEPSALRSSIEDARSKTPLPGGSRQSEREGPQAGTLKVLKRSARSVLAVTSGLSVRMRTLFTPYSPFPRVRDASETDENDEFEDADESSLVLCVELENPVQSGLDFHVENVDIHVDQAGATGFGSQIAPTIRVRLLDETTKSGGQPFPVRLEQGKQHNLLYYLSPESSSSLFGTPENEAFDIDSRLSALLAGGRRNVAIVVSGFPSPLLPPSPPASQQLSSGLAAPERLTTTFESKWNCTLDLSSLLDGVNRRTNISKQPTEAPSLASLASNSRPGSQMVLPPTAGSVRHSALLLHRASQADREQNQNRHAQSVRARPGSSTAPSLLQQRVGSFVNRSISFGTGVISGRSEDSVLSRTTSSTNNLTPAGQAAALGRGTPSALTLGDSHRPSSILPSDMITPRAASFQGKQMMMPPAPGTPGSRSSSLSTGVGLLSKARQRAASAAAVAATPAAGSERTVLPASQQTFAPASEMNPATRRPVSVEQVADPVPLENLRTIRPWTIGIGVGPSGSNIEAGQGPAPLRAGLLLSANVRASNTDHQEQLRGGTFIFRKPFGGNPSISTGSKILDARRTSGPTYVVDEEENSVVELPPTIIGGGENFAAIANHFACGDVVELEIQVLNRHMGSDELSLVLSWADDPPRSGPTVARLSDAEGKHFSVPWLFFLTITNSCIRIRCKATPKHGTGGYPMSDPTRKPCGAFNPIRPLSTRSASSTLPGTGLSPSS